MVGTRLRKISSSIEPLRTLISGLGQDRNSELRSEVSFNEGLSLYTLRKIPTEGVNPFLSATPLKKIVRVFFQTAVTQ